MKLLVARHGETDFNRQRKFYGNLDVPLNKKGYKQAQILAHKVIVKELTMLVQTNLQRTHATLEPIIYQLSSIPVLTIPDLAEKGFGCWEGLDADQIQAQNPEHWQKWLEAPLNYTPPTIESFSNFRKRVKRGLNWLLTHSQAEDTIFLVAHLGTLRIIYQELIDVHADFYSLEFKAGCYTEYIINSKTVKLGKINI